MHVLIITPHPLQSALIAGALKRQNIKNITLTPKVLTNDWCPETDAILFPHAFDTSVWDNLKTFLGNLSPRMPLLFIGKSHKTKLSEKEFAKWMKQSIFLDDSLQIDEIPPLIKDIIQKSPLFEEEKQIKIGEYILDKSYRALKNENTKILLTRKEYFLLELFLQNKNHVTSRDRIINYVWDKTSYVDPNTIEVHVSRLRKKLKLTKNNVTIKTIPCLGYSLNL